MYFTAIKNFNNTKRTRHCDFQRQRGGPGSAKLGWKLRQAGKSDKSQMLKQAGALGPRGRGEVPVWNRPRHPRNRCPNHQRQQRDSSRSKSKPGRTRWVGEESLGVPPGEGQPSPQMGMRASLMSQRLKSKVHS